LHQGVVWLAFTPGRLVAGTAATKTLPESLGTAAACAADVQSTVAAAPDRADAAAGITNELLLLLLVRQLLLLLPPLLLLLLLLPLLWC
jgi:hypothetical protein